MRFGEATDRAFVADQSVALDDNAKQQRVVVAVGCGGDDAQPVAAGFALHPQLLAGAAPEGDKAGLQRLGVADGIEKAQHQHLAGARILHDAGHEAVHLVKVDCWIRIAHCSSCFRFGFLSQHEKARRLGRRRALVSLRSLWPFTSGHGSPPAWGSHDDGDDRDGGGSASDSNLKGNARRCQLVTSCRREPWLHISTHGVSIAAACGSRPGLAALRYAAIRLHR